jgi:NifU-like protein involved in Fe-S cluster formation
MKIQNDDWFYTDEVKEHFMNPKNFLKSEKEIKDFNAYGKVGNMKCGDVMELWLKIEKNKIKDARWRTFGCASAIASTSAMSEMIKGMTLNQALKLTAKDIMKKLKGLPAIKVHCSVLGDEALREAIKDYQKQ